MNLPPLDVAELLNRYNLQPNKKLGQNFLIDQAALQAVIDAGELHGDDVVLEIGAGLGSLTRLLAQRVHRVFAVELDRNLIPVLGGVLADFDNVTIVQGDFLELDMAKLLGDVSVLHDFLVVANIPYYITSALIRMLLEAQLRPSRMVLTVQAEVAERITASPGKLSLLALSVQVYGKPEVVAQIPSAAFYPPPKVDSTVIRVEIYPQPLIQLEMLNAFFHLAKAGFSQKRKTLRNSLAGGLAISTQASSILLENAGIDAQRRAETLSISEWAGLAEVYLQSLPA